MDLARWGLQKFTSLSDRYRDMQQFLGDLLEGQNEVTKTSIESSFEVRSDVETLLDTSLPSRGSSSLRAENIFARFAPFFEAGFLLRLNASENVADESRLMSMFLFGQVFVPPESAGSVMRLTLPELREGQIIRGNVKPLLKALQLPNLRALTEASVFVLSPRQGLAIVLVCNRPPLWQGEVMEKTYQVVTELFALQERQKTSKASLMWKGIFG